MSDQVTCKACGVSQDEHADIVQVNGIDLCQDCILAEQAEAEAAFRYEHEGAR